MLGSTEDAEDVLQEVFAAAFNAICADDRPINARPWLYRIARNRCLNHLRRPQAAGSGLDGRLRARRRRHHRGHRPPARGVPPDRRRREELPETQRTALLLREIDALSYDQIAEAMDTTVPSVKSLLVRARVSLAEAAEARLLTCEEVRLELGQVAEGIARTTAPVRRHLKTCERCRTFRIELRKTKKALAAVYPIGPLMLLKKLWIAKLGFGRRERRAGAAASSGGGAAAGGGVAAPPRPPPAESRPAASPPVGPSRPASRRRLEGRRRDGGRVIVTAGAVEVKNVASPSRRRPPRSALAAPAPVAPRPARRPAAKAADPAKVAEGRGHAEPAAAAPVEPPAEAAPAPRPPPSRAAPEPVQEDGSPWCCRRARPRSRPSRHRPERADRSDARRPRRHRRRRPTRRRRRRRASRAPAGPRCPRRPAALAAPLRR